MRARPARPPEAAPTERLRRPAPPPPVPRPPVPRPPVPPQSVRPAPRPPNPPPPPVAPPATGQKPGGAAFFSRQVIVLIAIIAVAVLAGGLAGAELYARHRADGVLVDVVECVVEDGATISYGVNPPFLWQHITGHYTNISVRTAGDRVQSADGMTADVTLKDVRLQDSANSKGTIGSLTATLSWTSAGIKDTVAANLPAVGNLVTGVSTDPAAGTVIMEASGSSISARPVVTDGDLNLDVVDVSGLLPKDVVQTALNGLTKKLNDNYPLGIHADGVKVTDAGVVGTFSSQNASIPKADANPCFARL